MTLKFAHLHVCRPLFYLNRLTADMYRFTPNYSKYHEPTSCEFLSSDFFPSNFASHRHMDRQKALHVSPPCMSAGGLKMELNNLKASKLEIWHKMGYN